MTSMSLSEPASIIEGAGVSVALGLAPSSLSISPRQVNRYAGGSRYQSDGTGDALAREAMACARQLITPALVYAVHPVASQSPPGAFKLSGDQVVSLPLAAPKLPAASLAAIVCTLGPELEAAGRQLTREGKVLEALFLDAAGTALLENLWEHAYALVADQAQAHGLFPGCRFAPGHETMPMSAQSLLFKLVNAGAIGVHLNRHLVMTPNKSLSFFLALTKEGSPAENTDKCRACSIKGCRFRLLPERPGGVRGP